MRNNSEWFLTIPLEQPKKRRGDPLGLRPVADYFADALAPGLTGRTEDARWLTLLCWCLRIAGAPRDVATRDHYDWVKPLELLWVLRARESGETKYRQLPSIRVVARDAKRFGLSPDQWERYRQAGPYGAYRSMLISLALTKDDGWTLNGPGNRLANTTHFGDKTKKRTKPETYWKEWANDPGPKSLPEMRITIRKLTGQYQERKILKQAIFENGESEESLRRRYTVNTLQGLASIPDERELVSRLVAQLDDLPIFGGDGLALLPAFMELADAAMGILNRLWFKHQDDLQSPTGLTLSEAGKASKTELKKAKRASVIWLRKRKKLSISDVDLGTADDLAEDLQAGAPAHQLTALLNHHRKFQRGLPWMKLEGETISAYSSRPQGEASKYRFRLWQLSRMAVQCGAIHSMPQALDAINETPLVEDEDE